MTHLEREEIREMLSSIISTQNAKTDGKFDVIKEQLQTIKEQTTKTNGRVSKMEDKIETIQKDVNTTFNDVYEKIELLSKNDTEHYIKCPNVTKIIALENEQRSKKAIRRFIYLAIVVLSTIAGIALAFFQIAKK
jgi:hypothetical protein